AADRGAPRWRRDLASRRLRAAPARIPALARARPRWRRAAALPALHHADLRWHQALARLRRLAGARGGFPDGAGRAAATAARVGGNCHVRRGHLADRARPSLRHQRLRGALGRHPGRGDARHAAAVLVEQRDRRAALAERQLPAWSAGVFPRSERRELPDLPVGRDAARRHPVRAESRAGRLRRAAVAPGVPRPRAGDLERIRDRAAGDGALPGRSPTGDRLRAPWTAGSPLAMTRWDHILDRKPQELRDYVLGKVADQLVDDLRRFPPRIEEWLDAALEARYAN